MALRFAQISDVHLGMRLTELNGDAAHAIQLASREAVARCFLTAAEKGCNAVLIPGDLFDLKGADAEEQLRFVYDHAARYTSLKFFITPGNADAYGVNCPYIAVKPPDNVHIFTSRDWQTVEYQDVVITSHAFHIGEGVPSMDWDTLPHPGTGQLSILMLHAIVNGADDGRKKRIQVMPVAQNDLLHAGYAYVALGHLHAKIAFERRDGLAAAAYAGPPQCLSWDELGPGGFYLGELQHGGAKLEFQPTARHIWKKRKAELPKPYAERYRDKIEHLYAALLADLKESDILKLSISGELPRTRKSEITELIEKARASVFHLAEPELGELHYYTGVDPLKLPPDTLLSEYLKRCSMEAAQSGADLEVYEIARSLGWRLFTGQGLPPEITE